MSDTSPQPSLFDNEQFDDTPETPVCPTCGRPIGNLDAGGVPGRAPTSRDAAAPSRRSQRHIALWHLRTGPATADAIAEHLDQSPNQVAARLLELRRGGYVRYAIDETTGHRRRAKTRTDNAAYLQELTPLGRDTLRDLGDPSHKQP